MGLLILAQKRAKFHSQENHVVTLCAETMGNFGVKTFLFLLVTLLAPENALCPMLEEIASGFFSPDKTRQYMLKIKHETYEKALENSKAYANSIFKEGCYVTDNKLLESFFLRNIAHYIKSVERPHTCVQNEICVDLHALSKVAVEKFALKTLEIVEELREGADKKKKYNKVYFIPGWGKHTIGGRGADSNKTILVQALRERGYRVIESKYNRGMIYVALGNRPLQYVPPSKTPERPPGMPSKWVRKKGKKTAQTRSTSQPLALEKDQKLNNAPTTNQKNFPNPKLPMACENNDGNDDDGWELYDLQQWSDSEEFTVVQRKSPKCRTPLK